MQTDAMNGVVFLINLGRQKRNADIGPATFDGGHVGPDRQGVPIHFVPIGLIPVSAVAPHREGLFGGNGTFRVTTIEIGKNGDYGAYGRV